jgi:hypothetical protein
MSHELSDRLASERGAALILAMFMVMMVTAVGASLMTFAQSETTSTMNYKSMSQARYGAESGLHAAINYLVYTYQPPGVDAADPLAAYDYTTPTNAFVFASDAPVVLSSDTTTYPSNYPIAAKQTAFSDAVQGWLEMGTGQGRGRVQYTARARLVNMFQQMDAYSGSMNTFQTWEVTGIGRIEGAGAANVEVTAVIERRPQPAFSYAAFAKDSGCSALTFGGATASTGSYDSSALVGGVPAVANSGGDVGTNGNLNMQGNNAVINGTLSTPRTGVGNCSDGAITALSGEITDVTGGLVELPQAIELPTPAAVATPTGAQDMSCATIGAACTSSGSTTTLTPPAGTTLQLADVSLAGNDVLQLSGGTYEINSLSVTGNALIEILPGTGPVIIKIGGIGYTGDVDVVNIAGNGFSNPSYNPMNFQIIYGGDANVKIAGNGAAAAVVYAPNAEAKMVGNGTLYGSIMANKVKDMGNAKIVYDINLKKTGFTVGNPTMSKFTWSSF